MVGDDLPGHAALAVDALDLQQQALAQIARADAGRVERLHHASAPASTCSGVCSPDGGDLFERSREVAVLVQVADDGFGGIAHFVGDAR